MTEIILKQCFFNFLVTGIIGGFGVFSFRTFYKEISEVGEINFGSLISTVGAAILLAPICKYVGISLLNDNANSYSWSCSISAVIAVLFGLYWANQKVKREYKNLDEIRRIGKMMKDLKDQEASS